jgi:hypothetical protein
MPYLSRTLPVLIPFLPVACSVAIAVVLVVTIMPYLSRTLSRTRPRALSHARALDLHSGRGGVRVAVVLPSVETWTPPMREITILLHSIYDHTYTIPYEIECISYMFSLKNGLLNWSNFPNRWSPGSTFPRATIRIHYDSPALPLPLARGPRRGGAGNFLWNFLVTLLRALLGHGRRRWGI